MKSLVSFALIGKNLLTVLLVGLSLTGTGANAADFGTFLHVRVLFREHMPVLTNESLAATERTSFEVHGVSNWLQVIGIDTVSNPAFVVELKAVSYRAYQNQIYGTVSRHASTVVISTPIALLGDGANPQPTSFSLVDLAPDSSVQAETLPVFSIARSAAIDDFGIIPFKQLLADQTFDFRKTVVHLSPSCDIRDSVSGKPTSEVVSVQSGFEVHSYPRNKYIDLGRSKGA